jgi:hypothetical protein
MQAVEFTTELNSNRILPIPEEVAAQLPKTGRARVIILTPDDSEDAEWRKAAYEQFMREDAPQDAVYDSYV